MSVRLPYQTTLLSLCVFTLSLMMNACSPKQQNISNKTDGAEPNNQSAVAQDKGIPKYEHIFVIVEENKAYKEIIGSSNAPNINLLAKTYGLASNFYGEVHPSEANYIAMLGGSTFGIHDDDAFYCHPNQADRFCSNSKLPDYANHTVSSKSLLDQLEEKGLTWKGYFESIPAPGSKAVVYPNVIRALYASKHNGFISFKKVQDDPNQLKKIVGLDQLTADLKSGNVPNYSHIIANQCHEMHGLPECFGTGGLIRTGDAWIGRVVKQITSSSLWNSPGNNAIIITWDEDNNPRDKTGTQGCCGFDPKSYANFGGGQIPTIVITNHGPRGVVDNTPYNHYSLLRTTEDAFGISEYLNEAGNTKNGVKPMTALFATKSK
ncbi:alkaline phosphatase family protein [Aetokthonos hydrillicola Thurmond2011]|jgi:phospholipase C|uniref:Alkaline phosphatase family protein n=1 Tax=Aetokthonos hydrillicola Thurmond2011 TaxID=2712845 RepID=A0AAP5I4R6_9CYAN|nr:alkaline phosphatase family protein [Aetokthonos hydrillicola]MBO3457459.1 phosphoesterase [Aetokthonos hydrillicola CCALA 1050]MBW4586020.1 alkaline phosphatase family protein [Aetokthonos hydrillicola CCALA 1050]MDR9893754.1 alkaline phosphatase family protein [Aetokthonos hydrillicola Thurmond2011]